ncbi:hypothetical protein RND71_043459 [Anisodus tanguticus]|uniref:Bridge-like lipid transfer protein family member 1 C-terminal domain-containing protein n=1 Tax=Anisodus tanguticus TaxID=243964 RepID=A0AAE1UTS9_9SOLA|nr:hypothetical protein RND71_043459 [Anisodus tanguticus]
MNKNNQKGLFDFSKKNLSQPNQKITISFSGLCDIGSASFKYDIRRLSEILAFPKAWYRKILWKRVFLGDQGLANDFIINPKSEPDFNSKNENDLLKSENKTQDDFITKDLNSRVKEFSKLSPDQICEEIINKENFQARNPSVSDNVEDNNYKSIDEDLKKPKLKRVESFNSYNDNHKKQLMNTPWETLILFGLNLSKINIHMNMGNVMGNTNWLTKEFRSEGKISINSEGHRTMNILLTLDNSTLDAKGGIVGGQIELNKIECKLLIKEYFGLEPDHVLTAKLNALQTRIDYMGTSILMLRMSSLDLTLRDEWKIDLENLSSFTYDHPTKRPALMFIHCVLSWDQLQILLSKSTTPDIIKIITKLDEFFSQQFHSSKRVFTSLQNSKPFKNPSFKKSSVPQNQSASTQLNKNVQSVINPQPQRSISQINSYQNAKHHRHWQKSLKAISGIQLHNFPSPLPKIGTILGGTFQLYGNNISIACFAGLNFRTKSWAIFSLRHPLISFATEAQESIMDDENPKTHVIQNFSLSLGRSQNQEGTEVKFVETKKYFFQPELSNGKLSDSLCLPNIPLLLMASKAVNDDSEDSGLFYDVIDAMIKKFDPPMFENHSIEEFLFKGYKVEIFEEMKNLMETFKMDVPDEIKEAVFDLDLLKTAKGLDPQRSLHSSYVDVEPVSTLGAESESNFISESSEKKLRGSIAYVVSKIAFCDWPEDWPNLFEILMGYLSSGNQEAVYGSMKVFNEICHDVCDTQIPSIAPILLPKMYEIFINTHAFSIGTRNRAVQIFTIVSETIALMCEYDKTAIDTYLQPLLPQFTEALIKTLDTPDNCPEVDFRLKQTALSSLAALTKNCLKKIWQFIPNILQSVWRIMTTSASLYVKNIVNSESEEGELAADSDGEVLSVKSIVFSIFDFITILIEIPKTRNLIRGSIRELVYYILVYMQITDEQMQRWLSDPNRFVDEDDDEIGFTVRVGALEIILQMARDFEEIMSKEELANFQSAFIDAIKKHLEESNMSQQSGSSNWWKQQEACLFALGSLSQHFVDLINEENNPLSHEYKKVLDHIFSCRNENSVFYTGRYIWTAARFAPVMNTHFVQDFINITVNSLNNQSPIIQISALKSIHNLCINLQDSSQEELMKPYVLQIYRHIINLAEVYKQDILTLIIETIHVLLSIDKNIDCNVFDKVFDLALSSFLENTEDYLIMDKFIGIFDKLSKNPSLYSATENKLMPSLLEILSDNAKENYYCLKPISLKILKVLVRNSPLPLSDSLINLCFKLVCHSVFSTFDETSIMREGGETIRAFVSKSPDQIASFCNPDDGRDGMSLVMQVCLHLLDPCVEEACATEVGKLVFVTINKGSSYLGNDNVHLLLRSVLSKLQSSKSIIVIQSLIMVFAHLLNHNLETVLDFLSVLPGPLGPHSALEYVLTQWLSRQHLFYGSYEIKVTVIALCKLLEHSVVSSNSKINLNRIIVPGEPIITDSGIKTRSRTASKPDQWTSIPCSVKILKLLIHELDHRENVEVCDEINEDSDDDDQNDSNPWSNNQNDYSFNNSYSNQSDLNDNDTNEEDEEEEEDQDTLEDPISKINLRVYLNQYLTQFLSQSCANEFTSQLNEIERNILKKYIKL